MIVVHQMATINKNLVTERGALNELCTCPCRQRNINCNWTAAMTHKVHKLKKQLHTDVQAKCGFSEMKVIN
jgi:hypothetical protein